ncbi:MAG TPA: bifunctional methylenetetrahydrofolate dehydrogenase/methenyltetrahydrofolate cyclohydrolase FolD [Gemmatimonadales bacterium]|nr:bifunctional methylenetetrahydrofolate dehydrogenase/methenyltetrahydrofolate cyclohydrolase FolD [Gemmatimonadales bacterium]
MSGRIIDGVALGRTIRAEVAAEVAKLAASGRRPGLAVVLVGDNPASKAYVGSKEKACQEAGMHSVKITRPADIPESELLDIIDGLNADPAVHGILVQLPLPKHMDSQKVLDRVSPDKDVDGFHPVNVGKLVIGDPTALRPCTPYGVQQMLIRSGIETRGAHAVIVGRSTIVGKPMANLLIQQGPGGDATVTVCHSRTKDLPGVCRTADILVAAIGKAEFVTKDFVRPGAVVIDVGINRVDDATLPRGYKLVGDVKYDEVSEIASAITPVPGGVGPMTIAMLMQNTLQAMQQAKA